MPKITATDLVAIIIIVGCFTSIITGHDGLITDLLFGIAGTYGLIKLGIAKFSK